MAFALGVADIELVSLEGEGESSSNFEIKQEPTGNDDPVHVALRDAVFKQNEVDFSRGINLDSPKLSPKELYKIALFYYIRSFVEHRKVKKRSNLDIGEVIEVMDVATKNLRRLCLELNSMSESNNSEVSDVERKEAKDLLTKISSFLYFSKKETAEVKINVNQVGSGLQESLLPGAQSSPSKTPTCGQKISTWFLVQDDVYNTVGFSDAIWLTLCAIIPLISNQLNVNQSADKSVYAQLFPSLKIGSLWSDTAALLTDCGLGLLFAKIAYEIAVAGYKKDEWQRLKEASLFDKMPEHIKQEYREAIERDKIELRAKLCGAMVGWQVGATLLQFVAQSFVWAGVYQQPSDFGSLLTVALFVALAAGVGEGLGCGKAFGHNESKKFASKYALARQFAKDASRYEGIKLNKHELSASKTGKDYLASGYFQFQKSQYNLACLLSGILWQLAAFLPPIIATSIGAMIASQGEKDSPVGHFFGMLILDVIAVYCIKISVSAIFEYSLNTKDRGGVSSQPEDLSDKMLANEIIHGGESHARGLLRWMKNERVIYGQKDDNISVFEFN